MQLSLSLQYILRDVLTFEEIDKCSANEIRQLLEHKLDSAKQNTINLEIKFPDGDVTVAKEDLHAIEKIQKVYNIFMEEYITYLDKKENKLVTN